MQFRSGRWIAGFFVLSIGWGCYSSVAPTPKIDPGTDEPPPGSSSGIFEPDPAVDGCAPRKPWEGPGITGLVPTSLTEAHVLSGDRYFTAEFDLRAGDASGPTVGALKTWKESGHISKLWETAPPAEGLSIWEKEGVTAAYIHEKAQGNPQIIISHHRRWVKSGSDWPFTGSVVDDWLIDGGGGPPPVDGSAPWQGVGVTAAFFSPDGRFFQVISGDKLWTQRVSDPQPANWTWPPESSYDLSLPDSGIWPSSPQVGGSQPFQGVGITAAWYVGAKFFVFSKDRMWTHDGKRWTSSGLVKDQDGWKNAPTAGCD